MVDLSSSKPVKSGDNSPTPSLGSDQPLPSTPLLTQPPEEKATSSSDKSPVLPLKKEEKTATAEQKEIEKELSEIGISPKHASKKTKIVMAALGVLLLIATLPAAVYLVQQRQEIRKEAAYLPGCTTNCDIEIGPGKYGFVTAGYGMRDVKTATIQVTLPSNTEGYEAYAIWSGESHQGSPNYNDTSIKVNGHDVDATRTFQVTNTYYNTSQIANVGKIQNSDVKGKTGTLSFNVGGLDNLNSDDKPGGGHGIGIIVIYNGENVGWNKIVIRLWGEWLYLTCARHDQRDACQGPRSSVMQINLPELDTNRSNENKFAFFFGEGEKRYGSCQDENGRARPSHLYYKTSGDWTKLAANTGVSSQPWPACPLPEASEPGQWWTTRITGEDLPNINLDSNVIRITADSAYADDEIHSDGESYTFAGVVAQYPVEAPSYECWSECSELADCEPAGYTCAIPPGDTVKRCLNPQCPSEEACVCPVTTCLDLTAVPAVETLEEGSEVEFTCQGSGSDSLDHFEFRVSKDGGTWEDLGDATATKTDGDYEGKVDYTVPTTGSYRVECRVCTSSDSTNCTQWGAAQ
jgi:hypothetical protein